MQAKEKWRCQDATLNAHILLFKLESTRAAWLIVRSRTQCRRDNQTNERKREKERTRGSAYANGATRSQGWLKNRQRQEVALYTLKFIGCFDLKIHRATMSSSLLEPQVRKLNSMMCQHVDKNGASYLARGSKKSAPDSLILSGDQAKTRLQEPKDSYKRFCSVDCSELPQLASLNAADQTLRRIFSVAITEITYLVTESAPAPVAQTEIFLRARIAIAIRSRSLRYRRDRRLEKFTRNNRSATTSVRKKSQRSLPTESRERDAALDRKPVGNERSLH